MRYRSTTVRQDMAKKSSPDKAPDATKKTHSIRFTDAEWDFISLRAKATGLSISEYLVALIDADQGNEKLSGEPTYDAHKHLTSHIARGVYFCTLALSEGKSDDWVENMITASIKKYPD